MSNRLFLRFAVAAVVLAPLCAQAGERTVSNITPKVADITRGMTRDVISFFGFGGSQANNPTDPQPVAEQTRPEPAAPELTAREIAPVPVANVDAPPRLPAVAAAAPSVETPLHRLFCVEYARARSGLAMFGDARQWWDRAKNLYARASHPVEEAVMVFAGSKRLKRGHVAVVTDIVSPRQIIVDQANWMNRGEIDHATPVLDVSAANDWSQVRVWDMRSNTFGSHVYAISGFIAKGLTTASRD
ncbi:MAG TPA: CHAP domain-containing protein [Rhizomicrobium sp.]|nr:CHAP domain-containing protein [Rhizomicrobium sp.]